MQTGSPGDSTTCAAPSLTVRELRSPHGEAWEEIACPVCLATDSTLWLAAQDRLFGAPDTYSIVRCRQCGLTFVNPRPTFEALGQHYQGQYLAFVTPQDDPWFIRPFTKPWKDRILHRRLRDIESVCGTIQPGAQILDVGCGINDMLRVIKEQRGAIGLGIDLNDKAIAYVRDTLQMPVMRGTLTDAKLQSGRFDLLTMMHYLEHEGNPRAVLAEAHRVLKPGGHLVIEIPDATGWPPQVFRGRWASLDLPRHLVYFEEATLRRALEQQGFELLSYRRFGLAFWTGISVFFALQRENRVRNPFMAAIAAGVLGSAFLPLLPWTHEFGFAIARALPRD